MKYKLYTEKNNDNVVEHILEGRGIENPQEWINASEINHWSKLKNIEQAVECLHRAIWKNKSACIVVDCDVDGYTSAAILINYLHRCYPEWAKEKLSYIHHSGKQHGLADTIDYLLDYDLVICPDSASNDYAEHDILHDHNIQLIILDHHEAPHESEAVNTITVNNQLCDYPNKDFSGAGIVWQFCNAFSDIEKFAQSEEYGVDNYMDLCALGNCGDMMSYRSLETKVIINKGFSNITNPFFRGMTQKNKFSIDKMGGINYMSIAFYVVPFINAVVRSGTEDEKDLVFRALCQPFAFGKIESGKRGHKGEMVPTWEEAVRVAANVKSRQTSLQNESMANLERQIRDNSLMENAVLVLQCEPGEVEKNIAGLCANKIQAKYQRPTLVLTRSWQEGDKEYYFRGSARNYSMSEVQNFKDKIEESGLAEYAQGHQGAFGCSLPEAKIEEFIDYMNQTYKDVPKEPVYWVDYIWDMNHVDNDIILQIADLDVWGQEIPESKIALKDIDLSQCSIMLMSPDKKPTLKITLPCGLALIKFNSSQEEYEEFISAHKVMTAIIKPNKNEWNGNISAQGFIDEFELRKEWVF